MTQEEKQLLLKDICERLPYGVKAQVQGWDEAKEEEVNIPLKIYSINTDGYVYFESNDYDVTYCSIDACRLYLRPMSSMTEEEKKQLKIKVCPDGTGSFNKEGLIVPGTHYGDLIHYDFMETILSWLNENHFDYRGLIEKGLAFEAPEDMYKEE